MFDNKRRKMPDGSYHRAHRCPYCRDTGWVTLAGTITVHGVEYERGVTACRWCAQGVAAIQGGGVDPDGRALESNYGEEDLLDPPEERGLMTLEQYRNSPEGQADPHLAALLAPVIKQV